MKQEQGLTDFYSVETYRQGLKNVVDNGRSFGKELGIGVSKAEISSVKKFQDNFNELTDLLVGGYNLDQAVFTNREAIERAKKGPYLNSESLNTASAYVGFTNHSGKEQLRAISQYTSAHKDRAGKIDLGGVEIDSTYFFNSLNNTHEYVSRDQMFAVLANGAARLKSLLKEDDSGVPLAYGTARAELQDQLRLIEKAASKVYESPTRTSFTLNDLIEDAKKGFSLKTKGVLGFGALAIASCMVPVDQNGVPTQLPEVVSQVAPQQVEVIPSATAQVVGGGEFGIVKTSETDPEKLKIEQEYIASRKNDAREKMPFLKDVKDEDMELLQFGILINGKLVVTDELLYVENPIDPDTKNLYLLSRISVANNSVVDVYGPLMMDEENGKVVYMDLLTGQQKSWMEEMKNKLGWTQYFPYGGQPIEIEMDIHDSGVGGVGGVKAMVAYLNVDTIMPLSVSENGLEYSIGDKSYRLDVAQGKWVDAVVKFDAQNWAGMSPEEKVASVPVNETYQVGIASSIPGKENYVSLVDPITKEMIGAWDSTTGEVVSMAEAGFIVLNLNDGTKYQMPYFGMAELDRDTATVEDREANVQRAIDYMVSLDAWGTAGQMSSSPEVNTYQYEFANKLDLLSKTEFTGARVFYDGEPVSGLAFEVGLGLYGKNLTLASFMDKDLHFHLVIIDDNYKVVAGMMGNKKVFAPDPE